MKQIPEDVMKDIEMADKLRRYAWMSYLFTGAWFAFMIWWGWADITAWIGGCK